MEDSSSEVKDTEPDANPDKGIVADKENELNGVTDSLEMDKDHCDMENSDAGDEEEPEAEEKVPGSSEKEPEDTNTKRRSTRSGGVVKVKEIAKTPAKKGEKRKSVSSFDSGAKSKFPKYEATPVTLTAKTIYIKNISADYYAIDRETLTTIPDKEGPYGVGDLIWAKMTGYPWWPCIISIDPETGNYSRISGSSCKADRVYHVQYFGPEAYRGWTTIGMVMPFEGIEKFYERINEEIENQPKKKAAKILEKCTVKPSQKKKWNESVSEAELAMELDLEKRVQRLTFNYVIGSENRESKPRKSVSNTVDMTPVKAISKAPSPKVNEMSESSKKPTKKRKSSLSKNKKAHNATSEDVYDFDEDSDGFDNQPFPGLCFSRRPKGDFQVYLRKHYDEVSKENPDLSKPEVTTILQRQWDDLTEDIKCLYIERKAIYEDESNMLVAKRSTFGDDYDNDSDYDYNDSDDDNKDFGFGGDEGFGASNNANSSKSKRSKSKKSEKLFDKIKNEENSASNENVNSESNTAGRKRRTSVLKQKAEVPGTPIPLKIKSETKSVSTPDRKSVDSVKGGYEKSAKKNKSDFDLQMKKLCSPDESCDETNSCSDAASVNENECSDNSKKAVDRFCFKCSDEETSNENCLLIACEGVCRRLFHKTCLDDYEDTGSSTFICEECKSNKHKCFACNNPEDLETKKCEMNQCGRFYHLSCIENHFPVKVNESANSFICPLHTCLTCHLETLNDNEYRANKKKLVKCMYCPTAYHTHTYCIAAGTIRVSRNYVICPEHYQSLQSTKNKNDRHLNVNYCFSCLSGGNLICCESCPAAFHEECLEYSFDHDKSFYCGECTARKQLHYGDIVWVKLGIYRWWPGKICHPNTVPNNVLQLKHNIGDFPVYFYGSHDYYWVNKGRAYLFMEGDNQAASSNVGNKTGASKSLKNAFKLALSEAAIGLIECNKNRKDLVNQTIAKKPPPYQHINSNRYLNKNNNNGNGHELAVQICECKETSCSDENCLNRISLIECDPKMCPSGDKCKNQRFRKCEYVQCKPFKTESAGWGLKTLEDIKEGQFVIEYCGEVIDENECDKRLKKIASTQSNFYFLNFEKGLYIDAGPKGNLARFMNHSCEPNCITQKWVVNNLIRVGLFALKDISAGTELTFNYNLDCRGNEQVKCECGSPKCCGFIGAKTEAMPKQRLMNGGGNNGNGNNGSCPGSKQKTNGGKPRSSNSKRKSAHDDDFKEMHDDACFKCGEPGTLIMCDESSCPKSYHLACINLDEVPKDAWICPRHICMKDACVEPASTFCSVCPNSLCKTHGSQTNELQLPDDQFLCEDHRTRIDEPAESEVNGADELKQ